MRIEEQWNRNIFEDAVFNQKRQYYKTLYYSDADTLDISRMIYRLHSVGLVYDYTIDYNLGLFKMYIDKKDKDYYIEKTYSHLLKYLSRTKALEKKGEMLKEASNNSDVFTTITSCVRTILEFTYADIVKKRKDAATDLFNYISESINLSQEKTNDTAFKGFWYNYHFKEEMYYYFNAKYARAGYSIDGKPYSLLEDTEQGRKSSWETFEKFAKVLNEQTSFISECKMMKGSCKKIWRTLSIEDEKDEYVLKILYAFASFGLNNKFYYEDANAYLRQGFLTLYNQIKDFNQFNSYMNKFENLLNESVGIPQFTSYLNLVKQSIMLEINSIYVNEIILQIKENHGTRN
jgi:ATP-dependent DNA helicase RecQ